MTSNGGEFEKGSIFRIKKDGTEFEKLFDFDDANGTKPYGSLTLVGSELFGVTSAGGALNNGGVIFRLNTDGSNFTKLKDLGGSSGSLSMCTLFYDGEFLYGTTYSNGKLFKFRTDGSDFTVLHNFSNDVAQPHNNLVFDGEYLYGSSFNGNGVQNSTLYKIKPDGSDFQKIHDFPDNLQNTNVSPNDILLVDNYLYGSTFNGEDHENGYLYKIKTDGTDFTILYDLTPQTGVRPRSSLVKVNDFLYGTTSIGGGIFRIKMDGTEFETIFEFTPETGYYACAGLLYEDELFFGTTAFGGDYSKGTIFNLEGEPLSINELQITNKFLYPNPANSYFKIKGLSKSGMTVVKIYDTSGKLVLKTQATDNQNISTQNLPKGIYFVKVQDGKSYKLIKN